MLVGVFTNVGPEMDLLRENHSSYLIPYLIKLISELLREKRGGSGSESKTESAYVKWKIKKRLAKIFY